MRILAIYPGLNPDVNDIAQALIHIAEQGHDVLVMTARQNMSKSVSNEKRYQQVGPLEIHRPFSTFREMVWFPQRRQGDVKAIADRFQPDVVFCSQEYNMRIAHMLQERYNVPLVLAVEFAGMISRGEFKNRILPRMMPLWGVPSGVRYWEWLRQCASAIITYNPMDVPILEELSSGGTPVTYVPWCNQLPEDFVAPPKREKRMIYIGGFAKKKNTDALGWIVPEILSNTPTESALLIGSGEIQVVTYLQQKLGERVEYIPGCSRLDALNYIASSHFSFTTMKIGFGGLIGDSWAVETPLVTVPGNTALKHTINALVPESSETLSQTVMRLYEEPELFLQLQRGGRYEYGLHSAENVGGLILDTILGVVEPTYSIG